MPPIVEPSSYLFVKIPVENIYYLLCYAWDRLPEGDPVEIGTEVAATPLNLLAHMLTRASRVLLKRGIDHNYRECSGEVYGIKGKLLLTRTIKENQLYHQRTYCIYDEFSTDILSNRIWAATLRLLLDINELDEKIKREIVTLIRMLPPVSPLRVTLGHFEQVSLNRNNRLYGFLLNICRLIHENMLPTEKQGIFRFTDFTRDERKMAFIFESFVRNFYRIEQQKYAVSREQLKWRFAAPETKDRRYLPRMITDISLENEERKIIIDTKYYI
ncbi:MAG: hypothetical protein LUG98_04705, partial [Tannerellaceae bacterium]|nr:hypothetical protein [Tannerellaceae bacterium]